MKGQNLRTMYMKLPDHYNNKHEDEDLVKTLIILKKDLKKLSGDEKKKST